VKKDFVSFEGLSQGDLRGLIRLAHDVKKNPDAYRRALAGKSLGMIFRKSSTRTRVSFEVGTYQLGGLALFFEGSQLQLGRGETIGDTAKVLSRFVDGIMIRTFSQDEVKELAACAGVPVINGLTDLLHPCQILADLFTIEEARGSIDGVKIAYVGDGNNVLNSLIEAAGIMPLDLRCAVPAGYEPSATVVERSRGAGAGRVTMTNEPEQAVRGADVVYTDTWVSMGQEGEREKKLASFDGFQVNTSLCGNAAPDYLVMHCLPAHRGEEITDEVMDGQHSIVFTQAENRLHAQKALMIELMGRG
jgi:ornithine carbamoyltransferase